MHRNILKGMALVVLLMATEVQATTATIPVVLTLERIEQLKPNSKTEDDLYFILTEYSNQQAPLQQFVPPKPNHWIPRELPQVKKVTLWKHNLASGEAVELEVSLADRGMEPWSIDEDIGTFKLFLVNGPKDPTMKFLWGTPEQNEAVKEHEEGRQATFLLKASKGIYRVTLNVQTPSS